MVERDGTRFFSIFHRKEQRSAGEIDLTRSLIRDVCSVFTRTIKYRGKGMESIRYLSNAMFWFRIDFEIIDGISDGGLLHRPFAQLFSR